ncbi:replicative DNA helicase [[Mycoplasma] anseris]|uniref:Replicative DNA helicase n=1 Tax=[Mycoplasma] anseris TaxID=92400 RepID=A0A2Z4ND15_9BACT|nr:replicative DNA helicase [[Mycoplasma] anseris]AWX69463.1 replicative DNA helicase [[Mycoplasma] anseris]
MALNKEQELAIANNEATFLGLIIRESNAFLEVAEIVKPHMFHFKENEILYDALAKVHNLYGTFDIAMFIDYLVKQKIINQVSRFNMEGVDYISWLVENGGYQSELHNYAQKILDQYKTDSLQSLLAKSMDIIANKPFQITDLLNNIQSEIINIDISEINSPYERIGNKANEIVDTILHPDQSDHSTGLKFGFESLDNVLIGANPGDLFILAARPAMGKTAFALNIANNVANAGKTVLFFSLEMTNAQLVQRMISIDSLVPIAKLRKNELTYDDKKYLIFTKDKMQKWNLFLNDKPNLSISDLYTLSKRFATHTKVDLVIIDYLQLISDSKNKSNLENRQLEVSKISRSLKQLARELACPVISLSQLSRNLEKREDKTPILSDLRESGSIEQDADVVMFLHRKDYYNKKKDQEGDNLNNQADFDTTSESSITDVIVAKNRHGAVQTIQLLFKPQINRFLYPRDNKENYEKKLFVPRKED